MDQDAADQHTPTHVAATLSIYLSVTIPLYIVDLLDFHHSNLGLACDLKETRMSDSLPPLLRMFESQL